MGRWLVDLINPNPKKSTSNLDKLLQAVAIKVCAENLRNFLNNTFQSMGSRLFELLEIGIKEGLPEEYGLCKVSKL